MMQGAFFFPCSNRSRTRLAPTPTNISTKSEPEIEKNGTLASPATARASKVLPVPGGPTSKTPFGMRPPSFWNFCASRRNSIISRSSSFASSTPATSLNVTFFCCMESKRARLLPKESALFPPVCIWQAGIQPHGIHRSTAQDGLENLRRTFAAERDLARRHLVQHDPERKQVR